MKVGDLKICSKSCFRKDEIVSRCIGLRVMIVEVLLFPCRTRKLNDVPWQASGNSSVFCVGHLDI